MIQVVIAAVTLVLLSGISLGTLHYVKKQSTKHNHANYVTKNEVTAMVQDINHNDNQLDQQNQKLYQDLRTFVVEKQVETYNTIDRRLDA